MTIDTTVPNLLDPGERLMWSGKPDPTRYAIKKSTPTFLFGLFMSAFAFAWINPTKEPGLGHVLLGIPLVIVALLSLLSPFWHFFRGRRAIYALTDRRVLVDIPGLFPRRLSVPLGQIRFVEAKLSANSIGDVLFREDVNSGGDGGTTRDGFVAIFGADHVERMLRAAMSKFSNTSGP